MRKVELKTSNVIFVNVYANNKESARIVIFKKIREVIDALKSKDIVIIGGDFNCTLNFIWIEKIK